MNTAIVPPQLPGFTCHTLIGAGRHGTVWQARRQPDGREVAVKVVPTAQVGDGARFLREARVLETLDHPHVVRCLGAGRHEDVLWLAMALAAGGDCLRLRQRAVVAEATILAIARDAAAGLGALHRAGLVHRDLTPSNLLLDADGRCLLGDFGLVSTGHDHLTATGSILGTPAYLSPEQSRGDAVDQRSDIYGLAACLYSLLTSQAPYQGETWAVLRAVEAGPFPDPRLLRSDCSGQLRAIIRACTARDPAHRYQQAEQLHEDAVAVLTGGVPHNAGALRVRLRAAAASSGTDSAIAAADPPPPRSRWPLTVAAGLAGLSAGLLLMRLGTGPDPFERADFQLAGRSNTAAGWRAYLDAHPRGAGADTARVLMTLASQAPASVPIDDLSDLRRQVAEAEAAVQALQSKAAKDTP